MRWRMLWIPLPVQTGLRGVEMATYKIQTREGPTELTVAAEDDATAAWIVDIQGFDVLSVADGLVTVNA